MRKHTFLLSITLLYQGWISVPTYAQDKRDTQSVPAPPNFAGFSVSVALSEKSKTVLADHKESIIVAAYFSGSPKQGAPRRYVTDMGEIGLGQVDVEVAPGQDAKFGVITLKKDALDQIDASGPRLLINVFSGRKSSKNNLLDCEIYEGPLKPIQNTTIPIACKLIGETPKLTASKPTPN